MVEDGNIIISSWTVVSNECGWDHDVDPHKYVPSVPDSLQAMQCPYWVCSVKFINITKLPLKINESRSLQSLQIDSWRNSVYWWQTQYKMNISRKLG